PPHPLHTPLFPYTTLFRSRCLSYGHGITYWPLGEVLKEHFGILESDPPRVVLERLGSREILGMTLGLDVASGLHPLARRDRFQEDRKSTRLNSSHVAISYA